MPRGALGGLDYWQERFNSLQTFSVRTLAKMDTLSTKEAKLYTRVCCGRLRIHGPP